MIGKEFLKSLVNIAYSLVFKIVLFSLMKTNVSRNEINSVSFLLSKFQVGRADRVELERTST